MAGYRANNTVAVVAILVIVLVAAIVLYFAFGDRYATDIPQTPAPVVPDSEIEPRVELPKIEMAPQSPKSDGQ